MTQDKTKNSDVSTLSVTECYLPETNLFDTLDSNTEVIRHESSKPITTNGSSLPRIYIASKTIHAPKWRRLRDEGYNIISTWIDEASEGQTCDYTELSVRCIKEIRQSDFLILYCEKNEVLKGANVEAGAALAFGIEVRCVGQCETLSRVFQQHPLWKVYSDIYAALENK